MVVAAGVGNVGLTSDATRNVADFAGGLPPTDELRVATSQERCLPVPNSMCAVCCECFVGYPGWGPSVLGRGERSTNIGLWISLVASFGFNILSVTLLEWYVEARQCLDSLGLLNLRRFYLLL